MFGDAKTLPDPQGSPLTPAFTEKLRPLVEERFLLGPMPPMSFFGKVPAAFSGCMCLDLEEGPTEVRYLGMIWDGRVGVISACRESTWTE